MGPGLPTCSQADEDGVPPAPCSSSSFFSFYSASIPSQLLRSRPQPGGVGGEGGGGGGGETDFLEAQAEACCWNAHALRQIHPPLLILLVYNNTYWKTTPAPPPPSTLVIRHLQQQQQQGLRWRAAFEHCRALCRQSRLELPTSPDLPTHGRVELPTHTRHGHGKNDALKLVGRLISRMRLCFKVHIRTPEVIHLSLDFKG